MHYKIDLNEIRAELDWWLSGSHEPVMGTQKEQEEIRSTIFTLSQSGSYMPSKCPSLKPFKSLAHVFLCDFAHHCRLVITTELCFQS